MKKNLHLFLLIVLIIPLFAFSQENARDSLLRSIGFSSFEPIRRCVFLNDIELYPNPADANLNVGFISEDEGTLLLEIINLVGQIVSDEKIEVIIGLNSFSLDTSGLYEGIYFLTIKKGGYVSSKKFLIK